MEKSTQLAKTLNFTDIYFMSLGYIIGAGIFVLIGKSAKYAKNHTWISFLLAGILSILSIISYIELSSVFDKNSGEYDYISSTLGKPMGLISSICLLLIGVFTTSTVALGIGEYIQKFIGFNKSLAAFLIIVIFAGINIIGIKASTNYNLFSTFIETAALILIIVGGFFYINSNKNSTNKNLTSKNPTELLNNFKGISYATFIAMFAYGGFETTVKLTEEAKNPKTDIPRALIAAVATAIILYTLVSFIITNIFNHKHITNSITPIADIAKFLFGEKMYYIYGIIALISISNTILISILGGSRMLYGISKYYPKLEYFGTINEHTQSPIIAIVAIALASIFALLIKDVEKSAAITNYFFFGILTLVNLSLIILHFNGKYKTEFGNTLFGGINKNFPITPILAFITSVGMIIFSFLQKN
tara:strand:+ start:54 stop:1307 length:1254 start_codon:yes stop_codon:yes gene_type:complete